MQRAICENLAQQYTQLRINDIVEIVYHHSILDGADNPLLVQTRAAIDCQRRVDFFSKGKNGLFDGGLIKAHAVPEYSYTKLARLAQRDEDEPVCRDTGPSRATSVLSMATIGSDCSVDPDDILADIQSFEHKSAEAQRAFNSSFKGKFHQLALRASLRGREMLPGVKQYKVAVKELKDAISADPSRQRKESIAQALQLLAQLNLPDNEDSDLSRVKDLLTTINND